MNNYDPNNYLKVPTLTLSGGNFTPLVRKLTSSKLMIKWHCAKVHITNNSTPKVPTTKLTDLTANCEVRITTPMGDLFPEQHTLKIAIDNSKLIQMLDLENIDIEYSLYFQNPSNLNCSQVEVLEFKG